MKKETRAALVTQTFEILTHLGDMELILMSDMAARLAEGQRKFGQLGPKKKPWRRELYQELLDALVYASCALIEHDVDVSETVPKGGRS